MAPTRLGVVGHPVAHSLSPAFWEPALAHAGRDATFEAFDVPSAGFEAFIRELAVSGARGLNVTIPHKTAAYELADRRSNVAERTGAVNVVVFDGAEISGANTDAHGVAAALGDLGVTIAGVRALVLGAGGAGRAAVDALRSGSATVVVANRTRGRAEALGVEVIGWADVPLALPEIDVLVHTTSVGLDGKASVLDDSALREAAAGRLRTVLDVVYRPDETPLVHAARHAGLVAGDGLRMLVHQAAEAWRLFFGDEAPIEVMHAAAARAAGR